MACSTRSTTALCRAAPRREPPHVEDAFRVRPWLGLQRRDLARCDPASTGNAEVTLVDLGFIAGGPKGSEPTGRAMPSPSATPSGCSGCFTGQRRRAARRSAPSSASRASTASAPPSRLRGSPACAVGCAAMPTRPSRPSGAPAAPSPSRSPEALNVGRLDEGLGWLMDWDETETKAALACPTLALAARDDAVVPQAMSEAIWRSDTIRWSDDRRPCATSEAP